MHKGAHWVSPETPVTACETIRCWAAEHGIGEFDTTAGIYRISKSRLREYMQRAFGALPAGLRDG
jgi:hypothetical protein